MLWLKVKVGGSVRVGGDVLKLLAKDQTGVSVKYQGRYYEIARESSLKFDRFTLHTGNKWHGLSLGFEAPMEVEIRRI